MKSICQWVSGGESYAQWRSISPPSPFWTVRSRNKGPAWVSVNIHAVDNSPRTDYLAAKRLPLLRTCGPHVVMLRTLWTLLRRV